MTLLVFGVSSLLDYFLASLDWVDSVKELCHLMVKLTDIVLWNENNTYE